MKKPYALKLNEDMPLCGLNRAEEMEAFYAAQGTWVDLYLDGEYRGIYLLAESLMVGDGRVDIYDLEKENKRRNHSIVEWRERQNIMRKRKIKDIFCKAVMISAAVI